MNGEEIKEKILFNNQKIEELLDPTVFILQPEIQKYLEENEQLRAKCPHLFKNGECIYCGKSESSLK